MNSSCNSSIDSAPQRENSCDSHVSVYYEQNPTQHEEELTEDQTVCSCSSEEKILQNPPVEIHEENTTSIDLPPLTWHGYDNCPKLLTVTNTGRTILINGHWAHSRPYIEGGPLNGTYLFSQIHFHCPSEHEIDGERYPLEMHIVHYKTSYLTQERAMNEKDGTIVLVYLFKLMDTSTVPTVVSQITKLAPQLKEVNSRAESSEILLDQLIKPFMSNYYVYWGSVSTKKNCYLLQWIISCNFLNVTQQEVEDLSNIITCAVGPIVKQTQRVKPENDAIYRVGEDYSLPALKTLSADDVCNICRCYEVPYISCQCKWKTVDPRKAVDGASEVLVCNCRSKTYVCKSNCKMHEGERFCSKCKSIEITCCREGRGGNCSTYLHPQRLTRSRQSRARRKSKVRCELQTDGPESIQVLSCESANGSSFSFLLDEAHSKNKKKCKRRKKVFGRISKNSSDGESENSKSSAGNAKSKVKSENTAEKSESEGISDSELKEILGIDERSKEKTYDFQELQKGLDCEGEKGNSKCDQKTKKGIKDLEVIESVFSVKEISSKQPTKTNTELCYPSLNSSSCRLSSPNPTAHDDGTEEKTSENPQSSELKILPDSELREQPPSACSTDKEKKKTKLPEDITLKSPTVSRCLKPRSKSRANVNKLKHTSSSEPEPALKSTTRPSKSKSPVRDILLKRKVSIKKQSERSEYPNSKSKVSMPESEQSKTGKSKKIADHNLSQSVQEVKCPAKKSSAGIDGLTHDSKSPGDIRIRGSKLRNKESSKLGISKSKEESKAKNRANSGGRKSKHDYNITTLFEKKQNGRKIQSLAGDTKDVQVNFLLMPDNNSKSIPSCVLTTSESDFMEEKKASEEVKENQSNFAQDFTVNRTTVSESEFPLNNSKKGSQVCLLMEHVLHMDSKAKVYRCSSQEYRVAIMYDQNILQEYRGKFHPQELQLGNYEMLNLVPIYPEPENSNFQLQDCSVKKDPDQICIRVKFLMKELNVKDVYANTENELHEPLGEKKKKLLFDEETQYSWKEFDLGETSDSKSLKENQNVKKIVDCWSSEILNNESKSKSEERQKERSKNKSFLWEKEASEPLKCTIKLRSDPDVCSQDASQSSEELPGASNLRENKVETTYSEQPDKKLKPLFVKRRKTVYFIYDKVERDENTGKKVFVGSFKTKEEVDDMKKQKKLLQENEVISASEKFEETSEAKYLLSFGNKQANLEVLKLEESPVLKKCSPDKKSTLTIQDAFSNKKKDVVTLHKYRPKYPEINRLKKKCQNVLIGKVVDNMHRESNSSKNLAETMSLDKKEAHKISIYEVQEASDSGSQKKSDLDSSKSERRTTPMNVAPTKLHVSSKTEVIAPEKSNKTEEDSTIDNSQKPLDKKESQAALVLTPVEVESLSKIEVVLIEHLDNSKKDKKEA